MLGVSITVLRITVIVRPYSHVSTDALFTLDFGVGEFEKNLHDVENA
jgi:hypothetical protein